MKNISETFVFLWLNTHGLLMRGNLNDTFKRNTIYFAHFPIPDLVNSLYVFSRHFLIFLLIMRRENFLVTLLRWINLVGVGRGKSFLLSFSLMIVTCNNNRTAKVTPCVFDDNVSPTLVLFYLNTYYAQVVTNSCATRLCTIKNGKYFSCLIIYPH
jgi:hypothetical protein